MTETSIQSEAPPAGLRWLVGAAALVLLLQMTLGGLVASTYAGLACPDWPSCLDGEWFPSFQGAQGLHLFHRLNGYLLLLLLAASVLAARSVGRLRRLLRLSLLIGLAQIAAGVSNVLLALPVEITGLHSALAAALCLSIALAAREAWPGPRRRVVGGATQP